MRKPSPGVYAVLGALPQAAGYVGLPVLAARRGLHRGWKSGHPGVGNLLGLLPAAAGAGFIGWAIASHYQQSPESGSSLLPTYLVDTGAYAHSRNPLYVGGFGLWAGWALFFGSARVAVLGTTWLAGIVTLGVPFEERLLQRRFGETYEHYRASVPRWIGS
jgi:protein-S-isoprenylcysteine O-methyltransferase Ste14